MQKKQWTYIFLQQIDFGLYAIKSELEDIAFKYIYPEEYHEVVQGIEKKRDEGMIFVEKIMADIKVGLKKAKIDAEVTRQSKTSILNIQKNETR